ncbi:MAG: PEP-CTERM sorting domain-containing protein [Phycisphaeraceae bacterium]
MAMIVVMLVCVPGWSSDAKAVPIFSNGFETDNAGWNVFGAGFVATRVASGTNGITSAGGAFHAESSASGSATNWGGYSSVFPSLGFKTTIDIFLDVDAGFANNSRFDFSSAINNTAGSHRRDFIFNAGFFDTADITGPGAGTNRFVISASNNSQPGSAFAKNPAKDPIAIDMTGWYTFQHEFYNNAGVLAVDMTISDALGNLVHTWTLSDPTDLIGIIGGNRYGWFSFNTLPVLAFDNSSINSIPEPATLALAMIAGCALTVRRRRIGQ